MCPVCSSRISETRRRELNQLLAWSRAEGLIPVMVTLTARHQRGDDLRQQLTAMKAAKRRLRQRRDWKKLKAEAIVGTVSATEVTHGAAGWHTHFHEILLVAAASELEAIVAVQHLGPAWLTCLQSEGLDGLLERAFQVQGAAAAGNYLAKWGAAEELALSGKKRGRNGGLSPLELLRESAMIGDPEATRLWREFALAFKGAQQLVWSDGLKVRAGIDEIEDAEAAGDGDEEHELVGLIEHGTWSGWGGFVGARYRRVRILDAAETGGADAVWTEIHDQVEPYDEMPVEEDVFEDDDPDPPPRPTSPGAPPRRGPAEGAPREGPPFFAEKGKAGFAFLAKAKPSSLT